MKKILFSLMALVCCMGIDAQVVKLMKDGNVVATYNASQVDDVLFVEEDTHEYVDLDLPSGVKWATCNVGAATPEDFGLYFAWGETIGYTNNDHSFDWDNYKWTKNSTTPLTLIKYNTGSTYGTVDNRAVLDLIDDAANVFWGGSWRIPSQDEWKELKEYCTWTWDDENKGYKVASKENAERFIFLPAAGYYEGNVLYNQDTYYWSSSLGSTEPIEAYSCHFTNNSVNSSSNRRRYYGQTVRPVFK